MKTNRINQQHDDSSGGGNGNDITPALRAAFAIVERFGLGEGKSLADYAALLHEIEAIIQGTK